MPPSDDAASLQVSIVAGNPETLDGLQAYLERAGVRATTARNIEHLEEATPSSANVAVVFPDDFRTTTALAEICALRVARPNLLVVVVTNDPRRFERLPREEESIEPLIVPRPIWGWSILEAIRSRLEPSTSWSTP